MTLEEKHRRLRHDIKSLKSVAIAYSGGVDSSLLMAVAHDCLGPDHVLVLHNQTLLQKPGEAQEAIERAIRCGFSLNRNLIVIDSQPLSQPQIVGNDPDRCYHCKHLLYSSFLALAAQRDIFSLLDGTNSDDLLEARPGKRAIAELSVRTPLADAGLDKNEIRLLSRNLELETWNRPSGSCLATRISHSTFLRAEELQRVALLENLLENLGYHGCRVKPDPNNTNRIRLQIQETDFSTLLSKEKREIIRQLFEDNEIFDVSLDLAGRKSPNNNN